MTARDLQRPPPLTRVDACTAGVGSSTSGTTWAPVPTPGARSLSKPDFGSPRDVRNKAPQRYRSTLIANHKTAVDRTNEVTMAKLLVMLDGVELREVRLSKDRTTIGRRRVNDVVIDDRGVSGEHAVVRRRAEDFYLDDLDSTNGTFVNGEAIRSHPLQFGDRIEIGEYRLKFLPDSGSETDGDIEHDTAYSSPHGFCDQAHPAVQSPPLRNSDEVPGSSWPMLHILSGPTAGHELRLKKEITRFGRRGHQIAVVTRRPNGYFIAHVKGEEFPMVNGTSLGSKAHLLMAGDIIEVAGVWMMFFDDSRPEAQERRSERRSASTALAAP